MPLPAKKQNTSGDTMCLKAATCPLHGKVMRKLSPFSDVHSSDVNSCADSCVSPQPEDKEEIKSEAGGHIPKR